MSEATTTRKPKSRLLGLLKKAAALVAVLALLGWVIWRAGQDAQSVHWGGLQMRPGLIAASVAALGSAFFLHGLIWALMMRGLGYGIGWRAGMCACVVSQLGNYIPGKVFIMVVRAQVASQHGLPGLPVASSVVLETVLRNLVAAVVAALGLHWLGLGTAYQAGLIGFLIISAAVAHPAAFHPLVQWLLRRLGRDPLPRRLAAQSILLLLMCYLAYWCLYAGGFCLMAYGTMGAQVGRPTGLVISVLLAQIGSTLAVFAPVGLGVADATLERGLALTMAVSAPGVLALVTRVWRTLTELAAIGLAWLLGRASASQEPPGVETR